MMYRLFDQSPRIYTRSLPCDAKNDQKGWVWESRISRLDAVSRQSVFGHSSRCFWLVVTIRSFVYLNVFVSIVNVVLFMYWHATDTYAHANAQCGEKAICFKEAELIASHAKETRKEIGFLRHSATIVRYMIVFGDDDDGDRPMHDAFCIRKSYFTSTTKCSYLKPFKCDHVHSIHQSHDKPFFDLLWTLSSIPNSFSHKK